MARFIKVPKSGGQAPDPELREPSPEARETKFGLHAALGAEKLVPFIDDDALKP